MMATIIFAAFWGRAASSSDACKTAGLPFEAACLSFHETRRPLRTASSEQVRQPLYASGVGYWQHFAQELEALRVSLGDSLERFKGLG